MSPSHLIFSRCSGGSTLDELSRLYHGLLNGIIPEEVSIRMRLPIFGNSVNCFGYAKGDPIDK
jgi:hypothetical protein